MKHKMLSQLDVEASTGPLTVIIGVNLWIQL